jgi:tight adherence protein C
MEAWATVAAVLGCVGLTLFFFSAALRSWRRAREEAELEADTGRVVRGGSAEAKQQRLRGIGALLRPRGAAMEDLQTRATRAGLYGKDALDLFLAVRLMLLAVAAGAVLLAISTVEDPMTLMIVVAAALAIALVGPGWWLDRRAQQRQQEVAEALPETVDLLVVCLEAGLGLEQALERVVQAEVAEQRYGALLHDELSTVLADIRVGVPIDRSLRRMLGRVGGEDLQAVVGVISKAAALGAQMTDLLRGHTKTLRQRQLLALEEETGKASAKLTLPLTICLLPAALILMIGPSVLMLFKTL